MSTRESALKGWIEASFQELGIDLAQNWQLLPVSGDASFRRYFRVLSHNLSWIAVDAPPEKEDSAPFIAIATAWEPLEIHAPQVYRADLQLGFMLLSDLGDVLYLDRLDDSSADGLYGQALETLTHIQQCRSMQGRPFPPYDRALLEQEMELFRDWFIARLLRLELSAAEQRTLTDTFEQLVLSALSQPRVCVHRDYHSRNLMVIEGGPGVIDFQDAVEGPVTYDLVSLLRDCYIDWPTARVEGWALDYLELAISAGIIPAVDKEQFLQWFDLMGMQRHLKAIGIFARLNIRDGKPGYLADIPRTFSYLLEVSGRYPQFGDFNQLLRQRVQPTMAVSDCFGRAAAEAPR